MIEHILLSAMRLISKKPEQLIEILAVAGGFIAVVYILRRYIVGFISSKFPRLLAFFNKAGTAISLISMIFVGAMLLIVGFGVVVFFYNLISDLVAKS
ncbi:hypothetical protein [Trichlorobacter lovleyi]|jgi:hypothetical protein|uniref:Uncharacterized protein n=1 Tax=Trichlorobacter lovleyi (strain ATCC BAA-1151 / DSM 17278 / SZ) TaxID=398767 RepID=B3E934_TRIL1|nr:hypothetical protein [Trichlorobacter lovleyi]ACD96747.1 hypothetical protein Glov_3041 [Trichlorobacter lovleyi SZ]